ncbi:MAG: hypothetical protein WCO84_06765 [bacterium]
MEADFDPRSIGAIKPPQAPGSPSLQHMDQRWNSSMEDLVKNQHDPLTALVRVARANPHMVSQLAPAIREARDMMRDERDAIRLASHHFPTITRRKWAGLTCFEKYAIMNRLAHKAIMTGMGLTKDAVLKGMGFMTYHIEAAANKSKFYEGLVIPDEGGYRVIRRWGGLTDSGETGRIDGGNMDSDKKYWFSTVGEAKHELAIHYATRISHGYTNAYGPKHLTPDGHKLPMGEYPVGLVRQTSFGWGTQSVAKCIPVLKSLVEQLQKAAKAIKEGDLTQTESVAGPLQAALKMIKEVTHADSTMGTKLLAEIMAPIRRLEGGKKFLPDADGRKMRSELVTIINYVTKQTSFCQSEG